MRFGRLAAAPTSGTRGTEAFQPGARLASVAQHTQGERLCSILPVDRRSRAGDGCAAGAVRWTADTGGVDDGALSWPCLASVGSGRASVAERRIDCAPRGGVFGVRGAHQMDLQGQGRSGGRVGGAGVHCGGSVSVHCSSQDFMARRRCGCGGADGRGDAGAIFGFSHVQF